MSEKPTILIRPAQEEDLPFIFNSWLTSYKSYSYFCKRIRDNVYYKYHHQVCTRILERPTTTALVAVDPVDPSVIFGYLVREQFEDAPIVHYAYIKAAFRGLGICKELMNAAEVIPNKCVFTHWTKETDKFIDKYPEALYVPYLI